MTAPLVSVCIITYQHAAFIKQAIDGALNQQTDFPVEILIGEDESTDGTREICLDYARRFPSRVKVFLRSRRDVVPIDGRPRGSHNFRMTLREARGEFVAVCEGDDYWTDPEKLQRQVDYLRANPDCVGCFHDVKLVDAASATLQESYFSSSQDKFTQRDVLDSLLSRQATCSLLFRREAFAEPLPAWYLRRPSDLYLDILLTAHGKLGFVRRNMGAYRKHVGGVWSGQREANQIIELIVRLKLLLADPFFLEHYREIILRKVDELQAALFTRDDHAAEIRRLEQIVREQTDAIKAIDAERRRLAAESDHSTSNAQRMAADAQRHIDSLLAQIEHHVLENQQLIDHTMRQVSSLSATSREQNAYIQVLEKERDRLAAQDEQSRADCARYVKVIEEQTAYIALLQKQLQRPGSAPGA